MFVFVRWDVDVENMRITKERGAEKSDKADTRNLAGGGKK